MEFVVRYCMSDEEAQMILDNDGTPEANIYITTVTVDKATLEATDESGARFYVTPDTEYEQVATTTLGEFSFEDVAGKSFMFTSGAGAWFTEVKINADGTFIGEYSDSDMGDTGDDHPKGKHYYCNFDGKFDPPKMIDNYTFEFYIDTMDCHAPADKETVVDGTLEVFSAPYGMQDANKMRIYLPGTPVYMLSDEVKSWLFLDDGAIALDTYVLENIKTEQAFKAD